MKRALITGITGQDGSYLAEFLLSKGYEVHGIIRRASTFNTLRLDHIFNNPKLELHYGDLTSNDGWVELMDNTAPDEVYHLGAQSHVKVSFELPEYTAEVSGLGTLRILEAIRQVNPSTKFYQASTSELFGNAPAPQDEKTPFQPNSPYAIAKLFAYWMTKAYQTGYGLFAVNGILFNHESPRRGETFLTRKVTRAVARIKAGLQNELILGNMMTIRDWGYAPEYVETMWLMLQQDQPEDYVVGTFQSVTVSDFVREAFNYAKLDWLKYVKADQRYFRPNEVNVLQAQPRKAYLKLGWKPKVNWRDLARIMVDADLELVGLQPIGQGKEIVEKRFGDWHKWEDQAKSMGR